MTSSSPLDAELPPLAEASTLRVSVRLAVAVTAFSVLAYEIALTRIFSVLFRSPFVFLILSVAVCGLGLGAALAAAIDAGRRPDPEDEARYLGRPLLALALLLPLPIILLPHQFLRQSPKF